MDLLLIELVLWAGLFFLFWALKDGLGRVESDMESMGLLNGLRSAADPAARERFSQPEKLEERIGSYGESPIYRYAVIEGKTYQFDYVRPAGFRLLRENQRCIAPGFVYVCCQ